MLHRRTVNARTSLSHRREDDQSPINVYGRPEVYAVSKRQIGARETQAYSLQASEPHPHVHVLVKAMSEQGLRLNIRKATLRMWRSEFARHLREQSVRANATERLVRGRPGRKMPDGLFRARDRGAARLAMKATVSTPKSTEALKETQAAWQAIEKSIASRQVLERGLDR